MTPVLVSVDKAGDLKIGRRKCRLYKKDEVVKVAKKYGISTEKKTVKQLCGAIKARAKNSPQNMNNVPLAKLYPQAAKKMAATKIASPGMPKPKPKPRRPDPAAVARARANVKAVADKIRNNWMGNVERLRMKIAKAPDHKVMKMARELRRLR